MKIKTRCLRKPCCTKYAKTCVSKLYFTTIYINKFHFNFNVTISYKMIYADNSSIFYQLSD